MRRTAKRAIDAAQEALGRLADRELGEAWKTRYRRPGPCVRAIREWLDCRWYKDRGAETLDEYGSKAIGSTPAEWRGWMALAKVADVFKDRPEALDRMGSYEHGLEPDILGHALDVIDCRNWRGWFTLARHLSRMQMAEAVRAFKLLRSTGYLGEAVFVPLWIPLQEYREVFKDGHDRSPAWETLKANRAGAPKAP